VDARRLQFSLRGERGAVSSGAPSAGYSFPCGKT